MDKKFGKYTNGVWRNVAIIYDEDQGQDQDQDHQGGGGGE
jgi:hypothetical protein